MECHRSVGGCRAEAEGNENGKNNEIKLLIIKYDYRRLHP